MSRGLIVEDEPLVAMLLEETLKELGCEIVGVAHTFHVALSYVANTDLDFAVLDINLRGQRSFAIADVLRSRSIPHLFVTGYGSEIDRRYAYAPALEKPLDATALRQVLISIGALED